jgi:MFS family permease
MSFPAASLIISNAVPREKQGVGMSLVNMVVNYSISIALGIAGTVEMQVTKGDAGPGAALRGYRSAWYFGIGLAGLGLCFGVVNLVMTKIKARSKLRGGEVDGGFGREGVESRSSPEVKC